MSSSNLQYFAKEKRRIESFAQSGQLEKARKLAEKLCRKHQNNAESWFLLGAICGQQGNYMRAVECCIQTVKLAPHVAIAHLNLGVALHGSGRANEAIHSLTKAIELQADLLAAFRELGLIYNELENYPKAVECFDEIVRVQPNEKNIWLVLGNLHEKLHDSLTAEKCYRKSYEIDSNFIAAGTNLANVLKKIDRTNDAECIYKRLLIGEPDNLDVLFNLAVLYQSIKRYDCAEDYYQKVLELAPTYHTARLNLGVVCISLLKFENATQLFSYIIDSDSDSDSDSVEARRSLAVVYKEQNQLEKAEIQLKIIIESFPEDIKSRQDLSLILLQKGEFLKGWQEYEWRSRNIEPKNAKWPYTGWTPDKLSTETVLVFPEQGIGDEIMFSSCIEDLAKCANVVLACDKRLEPLFARSFPMVQVVGRTPRDSTRWLQSLPHIDSQISVASLPLHFRVQKNQFPSGMSYLTADSEKIEKWRCRYKGLSNKITVGISWRGGHETNTKLKRSIDLSLWKNLFYLSNINFINLQYGDCTQDVQLVNDLFNVTLYDWEDSNPLLDIDDFAAKIMALDLVVSIDNSTVHLSGALGAPTWILQPFSPDWRWMPDEHSSHWYTSVKQYRQVILGDWASVLESVAGDLAELNNEPKHNNVTHKKRQENVNV